MITEQWSWLQAAGVQEAFGYCSQKYNLGFFCVCLWCCVEPEAWLSDTCGSLPTWDVLWFCERWYAPRLYFLSFHFQYSLLVQTLVYANKRGRMFVREGGERRTEHRRRTPGRVWTWGEAQEVWASSVVWGVSLTTLARAVCLIQPCCSLMSLHSLFYKLDIKRQCTELMWWQKGHEHVSVDQFAVQQVCWPRVCLLCI